VISRRPCLASPVYGGGGGRRSPSQDLDNKPEEGLRATGFVILSVTQARSDVVLSGRKTRPAVIA